MINIKEYELIPLEDKKDKYRVKSFEQSICPVCSSSVLKVIGIRDRVVFKSCGGKMILIIRRLRCGNCKLIHHELPDAIVPYKRYSAESIEAILDDREEMVSCEDSTIYRIRQWFAGASGYLAGCLDAIANRWRLNVVLIAGRSLSAKNVKDYVGYGTGWLARTVRMVVNTNNWVHTRSAFLT